MQRRSKHAFSPTEKLNFLRCLCKAVLEIISFEMNQLSFETPVCQGMSMGAAEGRIRGMGSKRRLRRKSKKGIRLCEDFVVCCIYTETVTNPLLEYYY